MDIDTARTYLDEHSARILDLTIQLSNINSGTLHLEGLQRVLETMQKEYMSLGCEQIVMPVSNFKQINHRGQTEEIKLGSILRCWKRADAPLQVLLVGHMDTVFHKEHPFQQVVQVGGDILNGPGVADMKGGLAIMLWGLRAFEQLPQASKIGWEVILTSDEEIGSPGSAEILEYRAKRHNVGFVFEPGMDDKGTLAGARKGSGKFTLIMRGRAAHAGRNFQEGKNAICKMAEIIKRVNELNGKREGVTINIGQIFGGEALNVVPEWCICRIDVRVPNNLDSDWVLNCLHEIQEEVAHGEAGYKLELHGGFVRKPKELDFEMEKLYKIVQNAGKELGQEITWMPSGGCCDGNNLAAVGLPNVDTLGAIGGKLHSEQEYIFVPSLVSRAKLLTQILYNLSSDGYK